MNGLTAAKLIPDFWKRNSCQRHLTEAGYVLTPASALQQENERLKLENELLRDMLTPTDADVDYILAHPGDMIRPEPYR